MSGTHPDLYRTCCHEAAHATIARRLGYSGVHFRIWPAPGGAQGGGAFTGETYVFEDTSAEDCRLICLAGAVAELLMDGAGEKPSGIHERLLRGVIRLSDSDAAGAASFTEADTRRTVELVQQCWASIEAEMTWTLSEMGRASDGDWPVR